jgi:DNA-directed RNA polymerase subunit RPC12/RpoP
MARVVEADTTETGPRCPACGELWLRGTNLPGRYRCLSCLRRFELRSECPNCGAHSTIARMSDTANVICRNCGGSMLQRI